MRTQPIEFLDNSKWPHIFRKIGRVVSKSRNVNGLETLSVESINFSEFFPEVKTVSSSWILFFGKNLQNFEFWRKKWIAATHQTSSYCTKRKFRNSPLIEFRHKYQKSDLIPRNPPFSSQLSIILQMFFLQTPLNRSRFVIHEPVQFVNWYGTEPNTYQYDCTHIRTVTPYNGEWIDMHCESTYDGQFFKSLKCF